MPRRPTKFVGQLSNEDREFLRDVWKTHPVHTVSCRAHAILLSSDGYTVAEIQDIFNISKPAALAWIDRWQEHGRDGLEDKPRPGGPPILTDEEEDLLVELIQRYPRQPKLVLRALEDETGKQISRSTLRKIARKRGLRWKRFGRTMRHRRDEEAFREAEQELDEVRSSPNVNLAYFDEAAFSLEGEVPYGWQPIGERVEIPIGPERGNVHVLGVHEEDGTTLGYLHRGSIKGQTVADVLDDYSHRITGHTLVVLDNASVHTCRLINDNYLHMWNERGLYLYFLPPASPELNAIERVWEKIKYQILPLDAWQSFSKLVDGLGDVFQHLGEAFIMPSLQE